MVQVARCQLSLTISIPMIHAVFGNNPQDVVSNPLHEHYRVFSRHFRSFQFLVRFHILKLQCFLYCETKYIRTPEQNKIATSIGNLSNPRSLLEAYLLQPTGEYWDSTRLHLLLLGLCARIARLTSQGWTLV